jgi:hypothetical protein
MYQTPGREFGTQAPISRTNRVCNVRKDRTKFKQKLVRRLDASVRVLSTMTLHLNTGKALKIREAQSRISLQRDSGDHLLGILHDLLGDPDEFAILGSLLLFPLPGGHALERLHAAASATRAIRKTFYSLR